MKKIIQIFSFIVISLFILSIFGWMVFHISKGDKKFGFLDEPVKFMYTFPDLFHQSVEEVKTLPKTFVKTPADFKAINKLDDDLIVLTTYSDTSNSRTIELLNLKNDSVLYRWPIKNPYQEHDRILNPILLPNKNIIFSYDGKATMRIDSLSNIIWKKDTVWSHHAINLDAEGNLWACTFAPVYFPTAMYKIDGRTVFFKDNFITELDAKTGKPLFHKSIAEILIENNLANYLLKTSVIKDPVHLNDVQPALYSGEYFDKGDLFISLRQPSLILQYRPSTNQLIRLIEGPFVSQHDVDILNDSTLVFFDNNYYSTFSKDSRQPPRDSLRLIIAGDFYSKIMEYNLANGSFKAIGDSVFRANKIFSFTESLVEFIDDNTYLAEEQNTSILWVIRDDEVIYKNVLNSPHKGYHHLLNWTRIIKDYE